MINKQNDQIGNMKEELEKLQNFRDVVIMGLDSDLRKVAVIKI